MQTSFKKIYIGFSVEKKEKVPTGYSQGILHLPTNHPVKSLGRILLFHAISHRNICKEFSRLNNLLRFLHMLNVFHVQKVFTITYLLSSRMRSRL